ncbi:MAG: aldolase/citrate lyase family protein [Candidatus Bathyarchaeia archaeon]
MLREGRPTLGTHLSCTWPTLWEYVGSTRQFDYVEFGSQYGAWDLHDLDNMCRAAELTGLSTMIKIDRNPKDWLAQRAIAAGFQSVLFADIMSVEEVKECVRAVRLPPEGVNGFMGTRGVRPDDYARHLDEVVIAIMVEKKSLMDHLEEALAVDGIDMVQFGPVDYGLSLRTPGKPYRQADYWERIAADRDKAYEMALDAGVRPRAECSSAEECQYYIDRGVRDLCIGWETSIIADWCMQNGGKLRAMLSGK